MSLRFHEIAEGDHRILNPYDAGKLELLGEICRLREGTRLLDIACGKAEMLCQWAARHGITGLGVDLSEVFLQAARRRVRELGVQDRVSLHHQEGAEFLRSHTETYDVVCCVGATWIGQGLAGTVELLRPALRDPASLLVIGEPFWEEPPTEAACQALEAPADTYGSLAGTLERFEALGLELLEMVIANRDGWDRYEASQWWTGHAWLREHPDDPDAPAFRAWIDQSRRRYLTYGRRHFGWGVFVLRQTRTA